MTKELLQHPPSDQNNILGKFMGIILKEREGQITQAKDEIEILSQLFVDMRKILGGIAT